MSMRTSFVSVPHFRLLLPLLTILLLLAALLCAPGARAENEPDDPPGAVTNLSATTSPSNYYKEVDSDQDGLADKRWEEPVEEEQGGVSLTWSAAEFADDYHVERWDDAFNSWITIVETADTSWSGSLDDGTYQLRVRAHNLVDYGQAASVEVEIGPEDIAIPNDTRHATSDLGAWAGHAAEAEIDSKSVRLRVTDLAIDSWGPAAALSRSYVSSDTSSATPQHYFAAGWRFGFQRSLEITASTVTYNDEDGVGHVFTLIGSTWTAPNGFPATLAANGSAWTLTFLDRSVLSFDSSGVLQSEADGNGNSVTYSWSGGSPTAITAANGQQIVLNCSAGKLTSASYTVTIGGQQKIRQVNFTSASASVTYFPGVSEQSIISYSYDAQNRLTYINQHDWPTSGQTASQRFLFGSL